MEHQVKVTWRKKNTNRILSQYFRQKEGRLYLNKDRIVACKRKEEDKILYKYNVIVLPQLYQTDLLFRSQIRWAIRESTK